MEVGRPMDVNEGTGDSLHRFDGEETTELGADVSDLLGGDEA